MNITKDQLNSKAKTYALSRICLLLAILFAMISPGYLVSADAPAPGTVGYSASTPTPSGLKSLSAVSSLASTTSSTSPLNKFNVWDLNGDYVAAGIGMRNRGYGTITINLPAGSSVRAAYLYWDILGITADSSFAQGQFNGQAISGTLIGQGPDPCWGNSANFAYRADVTPLVTSSGTSYTLSGFRSATTNGVDPWVSSSLPPKLEGASLVIIYQNPNSPMTQVQLYDGSFETGATATLMIDGFTAPNPMVKAQTTFIGADGQTGAIDMTTFNGTQFPDIWNGADPQAGTPFLYGNLWDTMTRDVTNLVTSGSTSATASVQGTGDCLVWVAQAFSIQQPTSSSEDPVCGEQASQTLALTSTSSRDVKCILPKHTRDLALCSANQINQVPACIDAGYLLTFQNDWKEPDKKYVRDSVTMVGARLAAITGEEPYQAFRNVYGLNSDNRFVFTRLAISNAEGLTDASCSRHISLDQFYAGTNAADKSAHLVIHELGHAFENAIEVGHSNDIKAGAVITPSTMLSQAQNAGTVPDRLFISNPNASSYIGGFAGPMKDWNWQQSPDGAEAEEFADMYIGWAYGAWESKSGITSTNGQARSTFMTTNMPGWINLLANDNWGTHLFSINNVDANDVSSLNRADLPVKVRQGFQNNGRVLSSNAFVKVQILGSKWTIVDGINNYYSLILPSGSQSLKVYSNRCYDSATKTSW